MINFKLPELREFMVGYTLEPYNYTASSMKIYIPELMMDKPKDINPSTVKIPSDIFKSKEQIHVSTSLSNNNFITVGVSKSFTATFKTLGYDTMSFPHFPKDSKMVIFIPNKNLNDALVVPLI